MIETNVHPISAAVEAQLEHLRRERPGLATRIARAEHILITHLSYKRAKLIRVRVDAAGRSRFLVNGSGGAVYTIDLKSWQCSCPDHHRRDAACKHSIAAWVLSRATRTTIRLKTARCDGCSRHVDRRDLLDVPEGNMTFFEGERICRACAVDHGIL